MRLIIAAVLLVSVLTVMPTGEAQTSDSARVSVCLPPMPVVASASNGAGFINFCVNYPPVVQPGSTVIITATLTAPTTVLPTFTSAANTFLLQTGCTEGTPTTIVPAANGVIGTIWTVGSFITMTSEQCDFVAVATLTIAAAPQEVYKINLPVNIQTENVRVDNFNYLCDAPAIAPNAYSTTATSCNDPNLALTGTLDAHFPGDADNLGLDAWTTAWFWIAAVLFFSYMGWLVALAFAIPGLLASMVPSVKSLLDGLGLDFEALFMLCLLGFILELAANRFQWGGYTSGNRRLRLGA